MGKEGDILNDYGSENSTSFTSRSSLLGSSAD
jgi:hypothetical protein